MPRDPHDRAALTWIYWLPVHHLRAAAAVAAEEEVVVVVAAVLRPEVEVGVGVVEVEVEVLHHPEVAGVGVQGQDHSMREEEEEAVVQREALFFLAEVEAVQV